MNGDLRSWIDHAQKSGWLRRFDGVSWDSEMGAILEIVKKDSQAVLFDNVPGYPEGYRVLANSCRSAQMVGYNLGIEPPYDKMRLVKILRDKMADIKLQPHKYVDYGPVLENVDTGDDVDLYKFPVPKWNPEDGGRFIGTACCVITKDPDDGWVNVGTYRVQVHNKNTAGICMGAGKHGRVMAEKYWRQGKPCPVSICVGQHPLIFMMSGVEVPPGTCEYDFVGGLVGEPLEVVRSPISGLPIPSHAEVVIDGEIIEEEMLPEGPFGEYSGYYGSGVLERPIVRVKAISYRTNPILLGAPPGSPPSDNTFYFSFVKSAGVWDQLEKAGLPGIVGVWEHEAAGGKMFLAVAINQLYPGHSKQVGMVASSCQQAAYSNHMTVVVDEDIDPTDSDSLIWAMATRVDFRDDMVVIPGTYTSMADPLQELIDPKIGGVVSTRLVMDACKQWGNTKFKVSAPDPEFVAKVAAKFGLD